MFDTARQAGRAPGPDAQGDDDLRGDPALWTRSRSPGSARPSSAGASASPAASARWRSGSPDEVGLVDELGELTWSEIDERSTRLAHGLKDLGVSEGDSVAVLCRNHRYFVDVSTALSKLGADILYLNTAFSAPQLGEVCKREKPAAIVYDDEFTELVDKSGIDVTRVIAWHDGETGDVPLVEDLIEQGLHREAPGPRAHHPAGDPDLGHDGDPQGRAARRGRPGRRGRAALEDAVPHRRHRAHRGAAVPHLGLGAPEHGDAAGVDARAAAQVRPGRLPGDRGGARAATR